MVELLLFFVDKRLDFTYYHIINFRANYFFFIFVFLLVYWLAQFTFIKAAMRFAIIFILLRGCIVGERWSNWSQSCRTITIRGWSPFCAELSLWFVHLRGSLDVCGLWTIDKLICGNYVEVSVFDRFNALLKTFLHWITWKAYRWT